MSETEEAGQEPEQAGDGNINQDVIRAIPITLTVEVGTTTLKLRDLLRLSQGSVLELDRGVGEVVTVGDKLGISVVEIVAPLERVKTV
jgi:flagellar motor switch protein FliN/FliY